ncbi:MAG: DUF5106 domain-containing protein [Bacteroidetes bacterium]|nr:DUF5106 domain-containing protein [Bacteroidota bacterium]
MTGYRKLSLIVLAVFVSITAFSQAKPFKLRIKIDGIQDTVVFLANHYGNKQYIKDTIPVDAKGWVNYDSDERPEQGVYILASQDKKQYFEFLITDEALITMETSMADLLNRMKIKGSPENQAWFDYLKYISVKEKEARPMRDLLTAADANHNEDSVKMIREKMLDIDKEVTQYKKDFYTKNPKTLVAKIFMAMEEINAPDDPEKEKADSSYKYRYYKDHYWDNIVWSDERIIRSPVFHKKLEFYFDKLIAKSPDSINAAADLVVKMARANPEMFKYTVFYLTTTYERSKIMGMDAVFVHMVEKYYTEDQAFWLDSAQLFRIRDRANTLGPLILGKIAPELLMIDTIGLNIMDSLGILGISNSEEATKKYMEHLQIINSISISLLQIKAKYTVLLFWDPDCGHCKKVVPAMRDEYHKLLDQKWDVKVFAVDTQNEYDEWKKFILKYNLDWINVTDPYHRNDVHSRYDIFSTPVIYLLNERKEIIAKRLGPEQIEEFLIKYEEIEARKIKDGIK